MSTKPVGEGKNGKSDVRVLGGVVGGRERWNFFVDFAKLGHVQVDI